MEFIKEFWQFIRIRKILAFANNYCFGFYSEVLLFLAKVQQIAPFIYTIF